MKTLIMYFMAVLFIVASVNFVNASPFLVCDVDENTTSYLVTLNSGNEIETPAPLHYDLVGINEGDHVISVKAKNVWGMSNAVPFEFRKASPQSPSNIKLWSE